MCHWTSTTIHDINDYHRGLYSSEQQHERVRIGRLSQQATNSPQPRVVPASEGGLPNSEAGSVEQVTLSTQMARQWGIILV